MKKIIGLVLAALLWCASPAAAQLPLSVQRDLISKEADTAWEAKSFDELPDLFVQYRALGKQLPTRMLRMEASVAAKNNDHAQVLKTLEIYFKTAKPEDDFYKVALANYAKHKKLLNAPKPEPELGTKNPNTIPDDVQKDLLERKIIKAATEKDNVALLTVFAKYREHGFKMPPRYMYSEADAAFATNDLMRAKRVLQEYYATGDKTKAIYSAALDLFEKIEAAEAGATNPQKPPAQPKSKANKKSDALYAAALRADVAKNHHDVMATLEAYFEVADVEHKNYNAALDLYKKHETALFREKQKTEKFGKKRWGKSFGAVYNLGSIAISNAYMAGTNDDFSSSKTLMVNLDNSGEVVWEKEFSEIAKFGDLAVSENEIFVAGTEREHDSFGSDKIYYHASVMKIDGNGKKIWQKRVNIPEHSKYTRTNSISAIATLPKNSIMVAGQTHSRKYSSLNEVFAAKLKDDGSVAWVKTYGGEEIKTLVTTKDGGGLIGGYKTLRSEGKDKLYTEMILLRLNKAGNVEWRKSYYVGGHYGSINAMAAFSNGDILLGGNVGLALGQEKYKSTRGVALRIDKNGKEIWRNVYLKGKITAVLVMPDGGALLGGEHFTSELTTAVLIRIDAKGTVLWEKEFEVSKRPSIDSMELTKDGGAVLAMKSDLRGDIDYSMYAIRVDNVVAAPLN